MGDEPTAVLCRYIATVRSSEIPAPAIERTKLHFLDTIAAMVSGAQLDPGRRGAEVARTLGGPPDSTVLSDGSRAGAFAAALANGFAAHADETDDSHAPTISHPGCAVVPAVLAVAEKRRASGADVLSAVATGYDVGCRVGRALGSAALDPRRSRPSSHSVVGTFGAAAGAAVVEGLDARRVGHVLSFAAHSASGVTAWQRDPNHVQKAYVFAGMPASNGVLAAVMPALGLDGVADVFAGHPNYLDALSSDPDRSELIAELGTRYEILLTNIKKFAVASPAQAAVQAAQNIAQANGFDARQAVEIELALPSDSAPIVDDREMPDVNVQYLVAGTLLDRRFSFAMAHARDRMDDPEIARLRGITVIRPRPEMNGSRGGEVRIRYRDGSVDGARVEQVRGAADDPMSLDEVEAKARDLIEPVIGGDRTHALFATVRRLETIADITELVRLIGPR